MFRKHALFTAVASLAIAGSSSAGLVAHWAMNEGVAGTTATVLDESIESGGSFTDATSNATAATWVNDAERGIVVYSPEKNDFLAGTQGIAADTDFTWSIWYKTNDANGHIMGSRGGSFHSINPTNYAISGGWKGSWPSFAGNDGEWHHIAVVRSGGAAGNITVYFDGSSAITTNDANAFTTNQLRFGGDYHHWNEGVDAYLSDAAIWDVALSEQDVIDLANGAPVPEPGSLALVGLGGLLIARRRRG